MSPCRGRRANREYRTAQWSFLRPMPVPSTCKGAGERGTRPEAYGGVPGPGSALGSSCPPEVGNHRPGNVNASHARACKPYGLPPCPWKGRGLRKCAPVPPGTCQHPFHGTPGRTSPWWGLPTGFSHPRSSTGDRCAFSTGRAGFPDQHQQQALPLGLKALVRSCAAHQSVWFELGHGPPIPARGTVHF